LSERHHAKLAHPVQVQLPRQTLSNSATVPTPLFSCFAKDRKESASLLEANSCAWQPTALRQSPQFALSPNPLPVQNTSATKSYV